MKKERIAKGFLSFIAALASCSAIAHSAGLGDVIRSVDVPAGTSVDVALFSADGICHSARQPELPAESRRRYHAASISKLFTATVVLQLRDEGKLRLSDPVGKFVPEFASSPIRIEQLMTHTSGLRDRTRERGRQTRAQVDEYLRELSRQDAADAANAESARWAYTDGGYNLLGRVIENIAGKDFETVMRERMLAPLGMSFSTFVPAQGSTVERVRALDARGQSLADPWDLAFVPSSGLQSDAQDLAAFGAEVLAIASARGAVGLLPRSTLQEMTAVRVETEWSGVSQAYGWQLSTDAGDTVWRHAGGEAGFESLLALYPQRGFGIVVMGNREDWPRFPLTSALAAAVREGRLKCGVAYPH